MGQRATKVVPLTDDRVYSLHPTTPPTFIARGGRRGKEEAEVAEGGGAEEAGHAGERGEEEAGDAGHGGEEEAGAAGERGEEGAGDAGGEGEAVEVADGRGQEEGEKKVRKKKRWWWRLTSCFRAATEQPSESSSEQQQQQEHQQEQQQLEEEEQQQEQQEQQEQQQLEEEEQQQEQQQQQQQLEEEEQQQEQQEQQEQQQLEEEEQQQEQQEQQEQQQLEEEEQQQEQQEQQEQQQLEEEEQQQEQQEQQEQQQDQQQLEEEEQTVEEAWAGRSSDDYIYSRYSIGDQLGEGGFGVVYEGRRLDDGLRVAVKYVTKTQGTECICIPDHPDPLPMEIALTILANKGPSVPQIIRLLDWQDHPDHFVLVLECPSPCENLVQLVRRHGGCLDEDATRYIMCQAVHAANVCCLRGVFHRDIKLENLLFSWETPAVKLIDFGCGDILYSSPYQTYSGTAAYIPPEYSTRGKYYGRPATVWSLGVMMFEMLFGRFPDDQDRLLLKHKRWSSPGLSKECCHLLRELLHEDQTTRIDLEEIQYHDWFKVAT